MSCFRKDTRNHFLSYRKIRFLMIVLLCINFSSVFSQEKVTLNATILDSISRGPIENAHILLPDNEIVISDKNGSFSFSVASYPFVLKVSHASYGINEVTIRGKNKTDLIIFLCQQTQFLDAVQVSAERLRILTKKTDFSITDIEFSKDHLWMIILMDNMSSKARLVLANAYGDSITTRIVNHQSNLYKDIFGNVHLETKDSVFQLFSPNDSLIQFLYGETGDRFHKIVSKYVESFGNKLVYCSYNVYQEEAKVQYKERGKSRSYNLTYIVDSLEKNRKYMERRYTGSMWLDFKRSRYWKRNSKIAQIYEGEVKVPMFSLNDTLFILNTYKDSLLKYNPSGKFCNSTSVGFHKDSTIWDFTYNNITFLTDESTNSCYILDRNTASWELMKLNPQSGKIDKKINLPNFPGMTDIHVFQNAVYFLYYEKYYPFFTRLYRYQLRN